MHLIFDFDGTIIDSFQSAFEKLIFLAEQENFRKLKIDELPQLKELSSKELIQYLEIPIYKIPRVIHETRKHMHEDMQCLGSFSHLYETLEKLTAAGFSLGILTSNSISNVNTWLRHNKLQHLFKFVHNESHYFGKTRLLKRIVKKYQLDKNQTFYIGDETRDIEAAKRSGIQSIAVTWGFNSERVLLQQQPDFVARTPQDILSIFHLS